MLEAHDNICYPYVRRMVISVELRVLEYFLAVAREQNISKAAEYLHLTQPTLSRQLKDLENEFGKPLFIRGKRKVTLTEDGIYFRKRAEEIVSLARRTEAEMKNPDNIVAGDLYIGAGETDAIRHIARVVTALQQRYRGIRFHLVSGDSADLTERLDKGLFDFCLLMGAVDQSKYEYMELPFRDRWGVLMRKDDPLATRKTLTPKDIRGKPLIVSRQMSHNTQFAKWLGLSEMQVVATYNLVINASIMASEGMGYVLLLDDLINTQGRDLTFVPFEPEQTLGMTLVWKKYQTMSKAAEAFSEALTAYLEDPS